MALARTTDGFRAFTTETARRIHVREHPRPIPRVQLQAADGRPVRLDTLRGRWLLVDFVYTRCVTYCSVLGSEFARLQEHLAGPIAAGRLLLVSISFDPDHDEPARLAEYQRHSGDRGAGWLATRPVDAAGLAELRSSFGVTVVPDGAGGFVHNAAIAVVNPEGRLVAILDWDDPGAAVRYVLERLAS